MKSDVHGLTSLGGGGGGIYYNITGGNTYMTSKPRPWEGWGTADQLRSHACGLKNKKNKSLYLGVNSI